MQPKRAIKLILVISMAVTIIACIAVVFPTLLKTHAAQTKPPAPLQDRPRSGLYVGAVSCGSGNCHGSLKAKDPAKSDFKIRQDEYVTWVKRDTHAKAYNVLLEDKSKNIVNNLLEYSNRKPHEIALCLNCHALPRNLQARSLDMSQGVSCEACHGPASGWLARHTDSDWSHDKSVEAGMTDLRKPAIRAQTCLECHLGTPNKPEKSVDHELIAAGHPDLKFELDNFTDQMPRHWVAFDQRKNKEGRAETEGARAWVIGQAVAFKMSLDLLADRARKPTWPEFAEMDCFACHHSLRENTWRQPVAPKQGLGLPKWSPARFVMLRHIVGVFAPNKLKDIEADTDGLSDDMVKSNVSGSEIASRATRLDKSMTPIVGQIEREVRSVIDSKRAGEFVERIVKDLPRLLSTDIRSAQQAYWAVNTLVSDFSRSSSESVRKEFSNVLELIRRDVERPERFDPKIFSSHMQDLQRILNRQGEENGLRNRRSQ
jgi:Cytochrome c554 and c-prime